MSEARARDEGRLTLVVGSVQVTVLFKFYFFKIYKLVTVLGFFLQAYVDMHLYYMCMCVFSYTPVLYALQFHQLI